MSKLVATFAFAGHHYTLQTATGDADDLAELLHALDNRKAQREIVVDQVAAGIGDDFLIDGEEFLAATEHRVRH